jgi:hypothetical protein
MGYEHRLQGAPPSPSSPSYAHTSPPLSTTTHRLSTTTITNQLLLPYHYHHHHNNNIIVNIINNHFHPHHDCHHHYQSTAIIVGATTTACPPLLPRLVQYNHTIHHYYTTSSAPLHHRFDPLSHTAVDSLELRTYVRSFLTIPQQHHLSHGRAKPHGTTLRLKIKTAKVPSSSTACRTATTDLSQA